MRKYFLVLIPIIMVTLGQILSKIGTQHIVENKNIVNLFIILGYGLLILRGTTWIFILRMVNLSFAYSLMSLTYIFILAVSYFFFNETIRVGNIIGTFFIMGGVYFMGYGELKNMREPDG
jgi:drug/metabolite transporter (DMT)-like permease